MQRMVRHNKCVWFELNTVWVCPVKEVIFHMKKTTTCKSMQVYNQSINWIKIIMIKKIIQSDHFLKNNQYQFFYNNVNVKND